MARRALSPTVLLGSLAALLAVTFLVILGFRVFGDDTPAASPAAASVHRNEEVVAAAKAATIAFLDVDYRDMQPRLAKMLSLSTGTFKDRYEAAITQLVDVSAKGKVTSVGAVRYVGLSEVTDTTARAYVAADSTVANAAISAAVPTGASGEKRPYRFRLELKLVGGTWLVSGLEFVR